jgi:hypothetical protein
MAGVSAKLGRQSWILRSDQPIDARKGKSIGWFGRENGPVSVIVAF